MKKYAVIVAAGTGSRMEKETPKQFIELAGMPLILHSLNTFQAAFDDLTVLLITNPAYIEHTLAIIKKTKRPELIRVIPGAATRFGSVKAGLAKVEDEAVVFVHDGVRCLLSQDLIHRCYEHTLQHRNAIPAVAPVDTVRQINGNRSTIVDRNLLRLVQTPQTFIASDLKNAYMQAKGDDYTDDAAVAENAGLTINLMEGERRNIKITYPQDLLFAEYILKIR